MATTDGMSDDYDHHAEYQRKVAEAGGSRIAACVEALPDPHPRRGWVFVDLGSASGGGSLTSLTQAVAAARARAGDVPIACVHNDLLSNDWSGLFDHVAADPDGYLRVPGPAVLPMAAAVSFFGPTVPAGFADLQLSSSAAHWLRTQPEVELPGAIYASEATGAGRQALADQAADAWAAFVAARGEDLAPGGRLLVQCVGTATDDDGAEHVTARELLAAMARVADEMAEAGLLPQSAVDRYVFPVYPRTVAEARAPFDEADSPFEPVEVRTEPVANPYLARWQDDGDTAAYARAYAAFVRGFAESALRRGLFAPAAPNDEAADRLVDDFFGRLRRHLADDPERWAFRDWTLTVVATRR